MSVVFLPLSLTQLPLVVVAALVVDFKDYRAVAAAAVELVPWLPVVLRSFQVWEIREGQARSVLPLAVVAQMPLVAMLLMVLAATAATENQAASPAPL
jgi:hypothetical protein